MASSETTIRRQKRPHGGLCLLVLDGDRYARHRLPQTGEVVIGRADDADITIDHPSVSRHHARLRTSAGELITIEDLQSANGTIVGGSALGADERAELERYDVAYVGDVPLVIQHIEHTIRSRRFWSRMDFDARLAEACARAQRDQSPLAIVQIHGVSENRYEDLRAFLVSALDSEDSCTQIDEDGVLCLLTSREPEEFVEELRGDTTLGRHSWKTRVARFPGSGTSADELLTALRGEETRVDSDRGGPLLVSSTMKKLYALAEKVAVGTISVLILGETGAGKQVLAEHVHRASPRRDKPLVEINCAAVPRELLESELFGHKKGAFTGADRDKEGLLEIADGGTVFLDEIGDMSLDLQTKLLRVLENGAVRRVGAAMERQVDLRIIAATNAHIEQAMAEGEFREDLYYRISGIRLDIPPLRNRSEEILPLFQRFHRAFSADLGRSECRITEEARNLLLSHSWPGNIRELRNIAERATLLASGGVIDQTHLPAERMRTTLAVEAPRTSDALEGPASPTTTRTSLSREKISDALAKYGGNQTRAAQELGVSRRTLTKWIGRFQLPRPRKGRGTLS